MPHNAATGRRYSGINVLILWGAVVARGYSCQAWLTFRQALGLGGCVRKGERGTTVVYADRFVPGDERDRARQSGEEVRAIAFLKRFTVFSADQCDGLPEGLVAVPPPVPEGLILPEVEALIRRSGADLRLGGAKAFYAPGLDYIQVPRPGGDGLAKAPGLDPLRVGRAGVHLSPLRVRDEERLTVGHVERRGRGRDLRSCKARSRAR